MTYGKRPLVAAAFLILSMSATFASSLSSPLDQARAFATCAGRFAAMATRQSAEHDPAHELTRRIEADFEMLLDATLPGDRIAAGSDRRAALHWRVAGWSEIAALMRRQYDPRGDARSVARAERDLHRRLATCRALILPG